MAATEELLLDDMLDGAFLPEENGWMEALLDDDMVQNCARVAPLPKRSAGGGVCFRSDDRRQAQLPLPAPLGPSVVAMAPAITSEIEPEPTFDATEGAEEQSGYGLWVALPVWCGLFAAIQFGAAGVYTCLAPGLRYGDALWHVATTATTAQAPRSPRRGSSRRHADQRSGTVRAPTASPPLRRRRRSYYPAAAPRRRPGRHCIRPASCHSCPRAERPASRSRRCRG